MIEDAELLRRYVHAGSEEAFTALVHRRIGLVYAVALRRTGGDAPRAEDATQAVFSDLARKAGELCRRPVLAGWLYRSAQFAAGDLMRAERRRLAWQEKARLMSPGAGETGAEPRWEEIRPWLDELLGEMGERDRDALSLRFFEDRPFAEVGARLKLTEGAARMRVERALEKLRRSLLRRGVASTPAMLVLALGGQAASAAPEGLAATIAGTALDGAAKLGGIAALLAMNKLTWGLAGALLLAGGTAGILQVRANRALRRDIAALQSSARLPAALTSGPQGAAEPGEGAELARLRQRLAVLKARPEGVIDSKMMPRGSWRNAGYASPEAAVETLLWAEVRNDPDTLLQAYAAYPAAAKEIIDAWFAGLSDAHRQKFQSPERLLDLLNRPASGSGADPVAAYQVVSEQPHDSPDEMIVTCWMRSASGAEAATRVFLDRTPEGWKRRPAGPLAGSAATWQDEVFSHVVFSDGL